jgi:uncharacterized membrane protein
MPERKSKTTLIIAIILGVVIIGGCIGAFLITGLAGGAYFYIKGKKPTVIAMETPVSEYTPLSETGTTEISTTETGEPTEVSTTEAPLAPTETSQGNAEIIYVGAVEPEFPGGVRIIYDEDGKDYKDFTSGPPYEFARKLLKNSKWEIYSDKTFSFVPGGNMPRKNFYPLKGTAIETKDMVALTNYTAEGYEGGDEENKFNIAGTIQLDRSKPKLQLVFEYKFKTDKELNFGEAPGKELKMTVTIMQDVEKQ